MKRELLQRVLHVSENSACPTAVVQVLAFLACSFCEKRFLCIDRTNCTLCKLKGPLFHSETSCTCDVTVKAVSVWKDVKWREWRLLSKDPVCCWPWRSSIIRSFCPNRRIHKCMQPPQFAIFMHRLQRRFTSICAVHAIENFFTVRSFFLIII